MKKFPHSYYFYYGTLNKITQFWLVESSTINPKLYSIGVPIKFPWKRRVSGEFERQQKNDRKSLRNFNGFIFTKERVVYKFHHVQPYMETRRRQVKFFSVLHKTELASCHNSCVILMTMLSCKLRNYIILLVCNFVECTINKKLHDLLVQFVINRYEWFWQISNCTLLKARAILRTVKITRTY